MYFQENQGFFVPELKDVFFCDECAKRKGAGKGRGYGIQDMGAAAVAFNDKILNEATFLFIEQLGPDAGLGVFGEPVGVNGPDHRLREPDKVFLVVFVYFFKS